MTWFSIALGSSDLAGLKAEDLMTEGAENNEQIGLIREQILALPNEMAASHLGDFARRVIDKLPSMTPEVKPGVVRRAAEVVGDHPAGTLLRQTLDLYNDLLRNEMQLHLAIDGSDQVGTEPFAVTLSLRYTAAIGRELGGFNQYLQNNVYSYVSGRYQPINFLERFEKSIRQAFDDKLELQQVGFFDSMNPARAIQVDGRAGWEEKPLCYLILQAKDPSIDRLPTLQMDINTTDETGMVVLPVHSNSVSIDASGQVGKDKITRPVLDLDVVQTIDAREIEKGESQNLFMEVTATGRGMVPTLDHLFDKLDESISGYKVSREAIEEESVQVIGVTSSKTQMVFNTTAPEESDTYVSADEDGMFRLPTTRKWKLVFEPTGTERPDQLEVPKLAAGLDGSLKTERFVDMDLVPVEGNTFSLKNTSMNVTALVVAAILSVLVLLVLVWIVFGAGQGAMNRGTEVLRLPSEVTPFSAVLTLRRYAQLYMSKLSSDDYSRLVADAGQLEQRYFGENASTDPKEAQDVLTRWHNKLAKM